MLKNIKKEMLRIIQCKKQEPYGSLNSETNKSTYYFRPKRKKLNFDLYFGKILFFLRKIQFWLIPLIQLHHRLPHQFQQLPEHS